MRSKRLVNQQAWTMELNSSKLFQETKITIEEVVDRTTIESGTTRTLHRIPFKEEAEVATTSKETKITRVKDHKTSTSLNLNSNHQSSNSSRS